MSELVKLFLDNLLPIFLMAGAGYLLGKMVRIDLRSLSQVIFYIFSPCLVFVLITGNRLNEADIFRLIGVAASVMLVVGIATWSIGRALKLERRLLMAVVLTAMFMNAGNYGLSVNLFAFGEEGLAYASLYFVTSGIMTYTIGVVIASMGSSTFKQSILGLFKLPILYALVLALLFVYFEWSLPLPLERSVTILGNASIPSMLVLLGLQIGRLRWQGNFRAITLANSMRLLIAPLVAIGLSYSYGLEGVARQAAILESGMPSAVLVTVLAIEYDLEPSFVTTVVFASTFLSPLTLTPLLSYLIG